MTATPRALDLHELMTKLLQTAGPASCCIIAPAKGPGRWLDRPQRCSAMAVAARLSLHGSSCIGGGGAAGRAWWCPTTGPLGSVLVSVACVFSAPLEFALHYHDAAGAWGCTEKMRWQGSCSLRLHVSTSSVDTPIFFLNFFFDSV